MQQEATVQGGEPDPVDSTGLCLLSLDGGGVRGLSTLYILKGLMDRLNQKRPKGSPARKPCEVFDLMGGTSTGGLIAIMLGRLEMDVDECIAAYIKLMKEIFGKPSKWGLSKLFGKIKPQYDASKLEGAINEVINSCGANTTDLFNDETDRNCRVFVCSITQETKDIVRLRSYGKNLGIPATICQAARATSAATTFFEPVTIGARRFADGGLGANNPVDEVEGEASDIWCENTGDLKPLVKCFISIGTGNPGKKAMEDNLLKFVSKTLPELATQTEQTEKRFIAKWRQHYDSKRYFRFNVDQGLQGVGLAEYQEQGVIESATEGYLDHQAVAFRVRDCVENLKSKQSVQVQPTLILWQRFRLVFRHQKEVIGLISCRTTKRDWFFWSIVWHFSQYLIIKSKTDETQGQGKARWQVPFERNAKFTGREDLLNDLFQKVKMSSDATRKIAINGLGGVGKTQLVLELAHRMRKQCTVCWIPVNSLANLRTAYHKLAQNFRLPGCDKSGVDILELVQTYLSDETVGPWLLVLDNADDIDLWTSPLTSEAGAKRLIDYMPQSRLGSIIWTTRDRKVATRVAQENVVTVRQMDESGAAEMMRKYLIRPIENEEHLLPGLLQKLTYLPLAIVQAAAYINATHQTEGALAEYEELFSKQNDEVIERLGEDFGDYGRYSDTENAVAKTWLISFKQIRRHSPLAIEYLGIMGCVDPKDIPRTLLQTSESSSSNQQKNAIRTLDAFSFITAHKDGLSFDIHRLVHLATRGWLKMNGELPAFHNQAAVRLGELLSDIYQTNQMHWRPYIAHAQHAVEGYDGHNMEKIDLAEKCGKCLEYDGRYREAEEMYQIVLEYRANLLGSKHPETLMSNHKLVSIFVGQGKYEEAETICRRTLKDREKVLGLEHPDTLASVNNLGLVLSGQGKYDEAESMHRRDIEWSEKVLGPEHPNTLAGVSNLGLVLAYQGRYEEAETICRRTLKVREKVLGLEHPDTLASVNNLGLVLSDQGKYNEAESMHRRDLEWSEKVLGPEHPNTLAGVSNLGLALSNQGRYEEAEAILHSTLQSQEKVLGPEHPNTLTNISNFASILADQERYEEAEAIYRRALQSQEKVLGSKHPDTLRSTRGLASVLKKQGKHEEARAMRQQTEGGPGSDEITSDRSSRGIQ
ncbi:unnamed protein product [Penicillium salamii]|uniref:PNPLA domain-containing protein n=1 Tax=Penicillium salamii TaxID=1612424 RepID=A0A9W4NRR6_9EURO|nr:unnamed protein product [Penicillium salamii]